MSNRSKLYEIDPHFCHILEVRCSRWKQIHQKAHLNGCLVLLLSAKLVGLPIKADSALAPPALLLLLQSQQHATHDNNNFCEYNSSLPQQIFWIRITPKIAFQQSKTPKPFVALKSRCRIEARPRLTSIQRISSKCL